MAKKRNYVNNKDLLQALIDYREAVKEAENSGDPTPQVPEYVGKCILLIATRLATKPNFSGYSYKEEMISDGIENCLQYIHNFDQKNQTILSHISRKLFGMHFFVGFIKRRSRCTSNLRRRNNKIMSSIF